jgi:hypothetical protein
MAMKKRLGLPFAIMAILSSAASQTKQICPPQGCPPPIIPPFAEVITCATTAQFLAAAKQVARKTGTYTVVSTSTAMTGYIFVAGTVASNVWTFGSAFPMDANGYNLSALPEAQQEAVYAQLDINLMAADRSAPHVTLFTPLSFFGHSDAEISAGYFNTSVNNASSLNNGATVTIAYGDGSGIVVVYTVVWLNDATHDGTHILQNFALQFKKAWKNGQEINRAGTPVGSPTPGHTGGSIQVAGVGSFFNWTWLIVGDANNIAVTSTPTGTGYVDLPGFTGGGGRHDAMPSD